MSSTRFRSSRAGRFLVFEGLDGSGTTTQARLLVERLAAAGRPAHLTAEPSTGPVGQQIRAILSGKLQAGRGQAWDRRALSLLFAADRLDHWSSEIEPLLADGVDVVCDRYVLSSIAYQGLDCPVPWIRSLNRYVGLPDRTFFLRARPKVALARRLEASGGEAELFESLPLQEKIAAGYEEAVRDLEVLHRIVALDGEQQEGAVHEAVWATGGAPVDLR